MPVLKIDANLCKQAESMCIQQTDLDYDCELDVQTVDAAQYRFFVWKKKIAQILKPRWNVYAEKELSLGHKL